MTTKWQYGFLTYWREIPELVELLAQPRVMGYDSLPSEWPWRMRWSGPEAEHRDYQAEDKPLQELGAEGWEVVSMQTTRMAWRTPNISRGALGLGSPSATTAITELHYVMKRPIDS